MALTYSGEGIRIPEGSIYLFSMVCLAVLCRQKTLCMYGGTVEDIMHNVLMKLVKNKNNAC